MLCWNHVTFFPWPRCMWLISQSPIPSNFFLRATFPALPVSCSPLHLHLYLPSQLHTSPSWGLPAGVMPPWTQNLHVSCLQSWCHLDDAKACCLVEQLLVPVNQGLVYEWLSADFRNKLTQVSPCAQGSQADTLLKGMSFSWLPGFMLCNPWWSMEFALKASFPIFPVQYSWHLFKGLISGGSIFLAYHFQPIPFPASLHDFSNFSTVLFFWL